MAEARITASDPELGRKLCGSCNAPILWTTTEGGKTMPVDFAPMKDGTVAIRIEKDERSGRRFWRSRVVQIGESVVRRKSHFQTCPDRDAWRKR